LPAKKLIGAIDRWRDSRRCWQMSSGHSVLFCRMTDGAQSSALWLLTACCTHL
ncbi:uncharacterized, partial [Tachysurus ichikawai]